MRSSVHIIPQKQIISIRELPSNFEDLEYIVELAMDISDHSHRKTDSFDILLLDQDILELAAEDLNGMLIHQLAPQSLLKKAVNVETHSFII